MPTTTNQAEHLDTVKEIFNNHLAEQKKRRTPERYAIIEEIYQREDHFDAEALYIHMRTRNYRVSRATVYNTLELLVDCGLVKKHQFGDNHARYEKSYGYQQHDHLICNDCGKVVEFCDPRIQQIKNMMGELLEFEVTDHSLNLFGNCKSCQEKQA